MKSHSILYETRLYVLLFVVVICVGLVVDWTRLTGLQNRLDTLVKSTAPHLLNTSELARVGTSLQVQSSILRTAETREELENDREILLHLFEDARQLLQGAGMQETTAQDLEHTFASLINAQRDWISAKTRIQQKTQIARGAIDAMAKALLPDQQALLSGMRAQDHTAQTTLRNSRGVAEFLSMSEMEIALSRLSILTSSLSQTAAQTEDLQITRAAMLREINALSARVARLKDPDLRANSVRDLSRLRGALLPLDGALNAVTLRNDAAARRQNALIRSEAFVLTITGRLSEVSRTAAARFESTAGDTAKHIQSAIWLKIALSLVLVAGVASFAFKVIERGLIARVTRLAQHVRDMARGQVSRTVPVFKDDEIGEIERAVERSRQVAFALKQSNDELERFAYVAAHDLRSPLRAVSDLLQWTRDDYGKDLPQGAKDNLNLIANRANRMSDHLTALLDYARAGQGQMDLAPFNLSEFAEELRDVHLPNRKFKLKVSGDLSTFDTYVAPVKTILLNLVSNAVKHHDKTQGQIEIEGTCDGKFVEIKVTDDGPGISPEYHRRIFELFQTLRSRDEVESTGLGLALVQKLAVSLSGTIKISSQPSIARGSVFTLRLPTGKVARAPIENSHTLGGLAA